MNVFVTGATGYIGGAVCRALVAAGHHVSALTRTAQRAATLAEAGIEPVIGDVLDHDVVAGAAQAADAVMHAAFLRDAAGNIDAAARLDEGAVGLLLDALRGTPKPLVYTSGIGVYGDTGGAVVDETIEPHTPEGMQWRRALEKSVLGEARHGIVMRPAMVYGHAGGEIIPGLIRLALDCGASLYPGQGRNHWPSVYIDDLAAAYVIALRTAAPGSVLNAVGGEDTLAGVSEAIGELIGAPERTASIEPDRARKINPFTDWIMTDIRAASTALDRLGWRPAGPSLREEICCGSYRSLAREERCR